MNLTDKESLKYYRDIKNVIDTSKEEGKIEGKEEEKEQTVKRGLQEGLTIELLVKLTGLSEEKIRKIKDSL